MEDDPRDGRAEVNRAAALARDRTAFILDNTRPRPIPLCPEIALRVADEALPLWEKTEEELGEMGVPPPFWAFAWAGGQALARYVLDNPVVVRGRRVLDLGAGSGIVAIAALKAGAASAVAADPDPWAADATRLNAAMNGVGVETVAVDVLDGPCGGWDCIMAGDLFYERALGERVLSFLDRAGAAGADTLIGDPGRGYLPKSRLLRIAEYGVPTTRALEDAEIKQTAVWRLATPGA